MNQKQENKNSAYLNAEEHLEKNVAITATLPPLTAEIAKIKTWRTKIDGLIALQAADKGGVTVDKASCHADLIEVAVEASDRLIALATIEKKPVLLVEAKVTTSGLERLADTKLKATAQGLLDLVVANTADGLTYGVNVALSDKLAAKLTAFSKSITQPKLSIDDLKQITNELDKSFKTMEELFATVDTLIKLFKKSETVFHDSYFNMRKVVNTGKRSLALQILVKDSETGEGLQKVNLLIERVDETGKRLTKGGSEMVKNVKTSLKGGNKMKSLEDGHYRVTATRADYVTEIKDFTVVGGIMTKVVIELARA